MTTRPTTDGDTKRCDAVEPRWPDERCGALAGHEGHHSYHEHVEALWARISEQEVELERYKKALQRIQHLRPNSGSSLDACIEIADAALTPTTQDQSGSSGEG